MAHMKCVCFLQPSEQSLEALSDELREPKYGEYYLCESIEELEGIFIFNAEADFSNILSKASIERLAEVDEYEVVREVQV